MKYVHLFAEKDFAGTFEEDTGERGTCNVNLESLAWVQKTEPRMCELLCIPER